MANVALWDPFHEMDKVVKEMSNWGSSTAIAVPVTDVFVEDSKMIVHAHIAGLTEDEVDVSTDNGTLVIKGERSESSEQKGKRSYMMRESSVSVMRRIGLPKDADTDHITAHLNDGILRIEVPITEKPQPKKITIKKKLK
jgi:HSP20 family protein